MWDSRKSAYSSRYSAVALLTALTSESGGTNQSSDVHCQRRGRVPAVFFPAFLRSDRPMMDEIAGRFQHHRIRVKVLESLGLVQAPGEQDGQGDLIQLDAAPVGFAVDPEILVEASILLLGTGQIDQGTERDLRTAGRQQTGGTVAHVPCPDQMVAAQIVARPTRPRGCSATRSTHRRKSCPHAPGSCYG